MENSPKIRWFRSFRAKVAFILILSMVFLAAASDFAIYRYSFRAQFEQLRKSLGVTARMTTLLVDPAALLNIPPDKNAVDTPQYKAIVEQLSKVDSAAPDITYIYLLKKTDKAGVLRFIVDFQSRGDPRNISPALPGDIYDAGRFPEMLKAFDAPAVDTKLEIDEWGASLSGYAPIRDKDGNTVAILGIDLSANDVYNLEKEVRRRAIFVLLLGLLVALTLGLMLSKRVSSPVKKLTEGTRHIAEGDLLYRVKIGGSDEISELAGSFNRMAAGLYKSRQKLINYFYRVLRSFVRILEAKDPYTRGHSERVAEYSRRIAEQMGLSREKIELLREGALLHDIGKLGVQDAVLNKTEKLDDSDREVLLKHPDIGEDIVKPLLPDKELLAIIRGHHEKYDGTGYPDHIKGDNIDILAAIASVADSYDAMTSHRAYRKVNLTNEEAMKQIQENSGTQFNPRVVEAFVRAFSKPF